MNREDLLKATVVAIQKGELLFEDIPDGCAKDEVKILLNKGREIWSQ